jgi:hypothetical protein
METPVFIQQPHTVLCQKLTKLYFLNRVRNLVSLFNEAAYIKYTVCGFSNRMEGIICIIINKQRAIENNRFCVRWATQKLIDTQTVNGMLQYFQTNPKVTCY